ncbi:MAG: hypothetical protein RLZZ420_830 [Bacteroidota bacterium]|jgi:hypothetical protein
MPLLQSLQDSIGNLNLPDQLNSGFIIRLLLNSVTAFIIIKLIYFRHYRKADLFLTFFSFNIIIFLITYLLNQVEMTMGAAFGLFAVFSMLRYRTENISAKDMTYLFIVIALGLIMAVSQGNILTLLLIAGIVVFFTVLLESNWLVKREYAQQIYYEKIELIHKERQLELIADLKKVTGLDIHRMEIQEIDLLKDAARIIVYYH